MLYSPTARGFYHPEIHGAAIPPDAVQVTDAEYLALIAGQAAGQIITTGEDGRPALADPPEPTEAEALAAWREVAVVSRFQARAALHMAGLLAATETAVAAAGPLVQIAWADAIEFRRTSPTIAALAEAVGLTDEQIDDLFRTAEAITA